MSFKDKHILVVDDEPLLVRLNKRQLENSGFIVSVSTESRDALEQLKKAPDSFDLLLTDLTMPGLSGTELIKEVRLHAPDLPVVVLTGLSDKETERELCDLGVTAIVIKPVLDGELVTAVMRVFDKEY
ncbi:response regulator [Desulforhopalus sp. 52FAK]